LPDWLSASTLERAACADEETTGSTLSEDHHADERSPTSSPIPRAAVEREAERGYAGRFGAGAPRISDGQLLFLQHMLSRMQDTGQGGGRVAIVMNGSPYYHRDHAYTAGRIYLRGTQARRGTPRRVDYLLRYTDAFPIAVVEAKAEGEVAEVGFEQAIPQVELVLTAAADSSLPFSLTQTFDFVFCPHGA
jgi:hypothetical protein